MPRKLPHFSKRDLRHNIAIKKTALNHEAQRIASARKELQRQIDELSKFRFIKRWRLKRALDKAQKKATAVNMDNRLKTAVDNFEQRAQTALDALETDFNNLRNAVATNQPDHVVEQLKQKFHETEKRFEKVIADAEKHAKEEFNRLVKEHGKA